MIKLTSSTLKRFFEEEEGQGIVEYGLLAALLALASVLVLSIAGKRIKNGFNVMAGSLDTSSN